jgi:hypothetical protein
VPIVGVTGVTPPTVVAVDVGAAFVTVTVAVVVVEPFVPLAVKVYVVVLIGATARLPAVHETTPMLLSIEQLVTPSIVFHERVAVLPRTTDAGVATNPMDVADGWVGPPHEAARNAKARRMEARCI